MLLWRLKDATVEGNFGVELCPALWTPSCVVSDWTIKQIRSFCLQLSKIQASGKRGQTRSPTLANTVDGRMSVIQEELNMTSQHFIAAWMANFQIRTTMAPLESIVWIHHIRFLGLVYDCRLGIIRNIWAILKYVSLKHDLVALGWKTRICARCLDLGVAPL